MRFTGPSEKIPPWVSTVLAAGKRYEVRVIEIPPTPTEIPHNLTDDQQRALWEFSEIKAGIAVWLGEFCINYKYIATAPGGDFPLSRARRAVRALKRKGLLSFHRGLVTEEGEPAGAGYSLTGLGREALCVLAFLDKEARFG